MVVDITLNSIQMKNYDNSVIKPKGGGWLKKRQPQLMTNLKFEKFEKIIAREPIEIIQNFFRLHVDINGAYLMTSSILENEYPLPV